MATGRTDIVLNEKPFAEWPPEIQDYYRQRYGDNVGERIDNGERLTN